MQGVFQLAEQLQLAKAEVVQWRWRLHQCAAAGPEGGGEVEPIEQGQGVAERAVEGADFGVGIGVDFAEQQQGVAVEQGPFFDQGGQAPELAAAAVAVIAQGQFTPQGGMAGLHVDQQLGAVGVLTDAVEVGFEQTDAGQLLNPGELGRQRW